MFWSNYFWTVWRKKPNTYYFEGVIPLWEPDNISNRKRNKSRWDSFFHCLPESSYKCEESKGWKLPNTYKILSKSQSKNYDNYRKELILQYILTTKILIYITWYFAVFAEKNGVRQVFSLFWANFPLCKGQEISEDILHVLISSKNQYFIFLRV